MSISINLILIIIGLLSPYHIHVVGDFYLVEILLLICLGMMIRRHGAMLKDPFPKKILLFMFIWLIGQVLTDVIRLSDFHDAARGFSAIVFLAIDFCAVYMLVWGHKKRIYILLIASAVGTLIQFFIQPTDYAISEPWKFGVGSSIITLLFVLLLFLMQKKMISKFLVLCVLFLMGMLSIYLNARTMGGQVILAGVIFFYSQQRFFYQLFLRRISMGKVLLLSVLGLMLIGGILKTYQIVGESGILPENSQQKFDLNRQALSGPLGMLGFVLAGRNEFLASTQAVYDSPIIGHGSWAEDPKYRLLLYKINDILGTDRDEATLERGIESNARIPAHSHIMQAWVWAGILGAAFWFMVLKTTLQILIKSLQYQHEMTLLVIFVSMNIVWDVFFSPFGGGVRFHWAIILSLLALAQYMSKEAAQKAQQQRVLT